MEISKNRLVVPNYGNKETGQTRYVNSNKQSFVVVPPNVHAWRVDYYACLMICDKDNKFTKDAHFDSISEQI